MSQRLHIHNRQNYEDIDSDLRSQLSKGKQLLSYNSTNDELVEG